MFNAQLDKFTIKWDFYAVLTLLLLLWGFYILYIKPILSKISLLIYGKSLGSYGSLEFFKYISPLLGFESGDILISVLAEGVTLFSLLPL